MQYKNTISNKQSNKSPLEPSRFTIAGTKYSNIAEAQKQNYMKVIEFFDEEMNKSPKEI